MNWEDIIAALSANTQRAPIPQRRQTPPVIGPGGVTSPPFVPSVAVGVGHNPDAVPLVRGANGGSWYAMPFSIKPDLGQVSKNLSKPLAVISTNES